MRTLFVMPFIVIFRIGLYTCSLTLRLFKVYLRKRMSPILNGIGDIF